MLGFFGSLRARRTRIEGAALLLVVAAMSGGVSAEETAARDIGEVIVTASRTPLETWHTGSSVTVITSEEIERSKASTVSDLLRQVPGITVAESGGRGTTTNIRIRGADNTHTLFLIDGVRAHSNTSTASAAQIQHIPLENIDRIEIVRGAQSSLYGSDAIGGVIQIFTKKGTRNATSISYEGGTYGTNEIKAASQIVSDDHSISIAGSWMELDGFSRFPAARGGFEDDGYRRKTATIGYRTTRPWVDVDLSFWYIDGNAEGDNTGSEDLDDFSHNKDMILSIGLGKEIGRWKHALKLTGYEDDLNVDGTDRIFSSTKGAHWQSELALTGGHRVIAGYQHENRQGINQFTFVDKYSSNAYFGEALAKVGRNFDLTVGGRHEAHSDYGDVNTWRATGNYTGLKNARLFGTYSTGFRAPTFNELSFPNFGNPNLLPEESKGWDLGAEYLFGSSFAFTGAYFSTDFTNLIDGSPAANTAKASSTGFELSAVWYPTTKLTMDGSYMYNDAIDEINQRRLQRRPNNQASGHVGYTLSDKWSFDYYYRYVGNTFSSANQTRPLPHFSVSDAVINYRHNDHHKFWVRGENIFDKEYEEIQRLATPAQSFYGGYEYSF